jgi:hypothetical protein
MGFVAANADWAAAEPRQRPRTLAAPRQAVLRHGSRQPSEFVKPPRKRTLTSRRLCTHRPSAAGTLSRLACAHAFFANRVNTIYSSRCHDRMGRCEFTRLPRMTVKQMETL